MNVDQVIKIVKEIVRPLRNRIDATVTMGTIAQWDDGTKLPTVQIKLRAGEVRDAIAVWNPFGFVSRPPAGTPVECVVLGVAGSRRHSLVIAYAARQYRLQNLADGEAVLHDSRGQWVHLLADGSIHVNATNRVDVDAPLVYATGDLHVAGNFTCAGDAGIDGAAVVAGQITGGSVVTGAGVDLDAHTHVETGGTTQPPAPTGTAGTGPDEPDAPSEPVGGRPVLPDPPPGGYIP